MSPQINAVSTPARRIYSAESLLRTIQRNPPAAFTIFVLIHVALWTVVPALLQRNLQLDAIEGVAYGRDWQLGYWKHPPLPWLLMDLTHRVFGTWLWPFFLLGQLATAVAFWATWRLGRELFTPLEAFVAVVILDGNIEYSFNTTAFNHHILELPFFALAGWSLYRAFVDNSLRDWLLVGLWFTLAFYTKYQAFVLLLPALAFAVVDPQARRCWGKPGPYIASAVTAALCAPQLAWMVLVDHYGPIKFAEGKAQSAQSLLDLLWATIKFAVNGFFYIIPVAGLFLLLIGPQDRKKPLPTASTDPFGRRYLAFLAFGPLAMCVAIGLLSGRHLQSGWAELSWSFISLYLIAQWRPPVDQPALRRLLIGWCGITGIFVAAKIATEVFLVAQGYLMQSQFPGEQFSTMVARAWHEEVGTSPLSYVVGEFWSAGNVIMYSPEQPRLFEKGDPTHSPRVDPADIRRRGAVILFDPQARLNKQPTPETSAPWLAEFPGAEPRPPFVIRQQTPRGEIAWAIGWALLRPRAAAGSAKP
jgi:Dolichyl-phosphate-mannose-protein mannosyltransferase